MVGEDGDWSPMLKSGSNGFLNVLGSLVALRTASETSFRAALRDVVWVLEHTVAAKENPRYVFLMLFVRLHSHCSLVLKPEAST